MYPSVNLQRGAVTSPVTVMTTVSLVFCFRDSFPPEPDSILMLWCTMLPSPYHGTVFKRLLRNVSDNAFEFKKLKISPLCLMASTATQFRKQSLSQIHQINKFE